MKLTYLTVAGSEAAYRITIESPVMTPMTRRAHGPAAHTTSVEAEFRRLPSLTKAAPQSTSHSQVMTLSSEVQPIGKFEQIPGKRSAP